MLPFLALFLYVILEVAMAIWHWHTLQRLVDETARYAIVNPDARVSEVALAGLKRAVGLKAKHLQLRVWMDKVGPDGGPVIEIAATYSHQLMAARLVDAGSGIELQARSRMPVVE